YGTWRGTSMAAPFATGAVALLRSLFPAMRPTKLIDHIVNTSKKVASPIPARIDIGAALTTSPADTQIPAVVQLNAANYTVDEGAGRVNLTVVRDGDTSTAVSVNYATGDNAGLQDCNVVNGIASPRCDFSTTVGTLRFGVGERVKTLTIPLVDDAYIEGNETLGLALSGASGANLGSFNAATIVISDNDALPASSNPIEQVPFFVRQHYIDFLGREPEPQGYQGWQDTLNNCAPGDTNCDRINVSAAFFRSAEFQERGYFVYRFYAAALGRLPHFVEFMPDIALVSGFLDSAQLEANKVAFVGAFMSRPEFKTKYDATAADPAGYVNALVNTAGVVLPQRQALIDDLMAGRKTRAQVLREVAESPEVTVRFFNEGFVVMQYFGYLRRDPDILYQDWINTMNQNRGDYRTMVNGFVNSLEYRKRFGQP
ncbi:MAG TPA: DUF4214 domain-containing protein, partial [Pyrinomonadaceae bacterium]